MQQLIWLIPLGFVVGSFGTLIGAGGGFILVPVLLLIYPEKAPETITSISLAVVFFNALSGSIAYARMKRIDYRSGIVFSLATIPGAILGSLTVSMISRKLFNGIFGVILIILSIYLMTSKTKSDVDKRTVKIGGLTRRITDAEGNAYEYSFNMVIGILISVVVGYVSSLLGIGGGIIHVPALIHILNFPIHLATATSHFILSIMALSGSIVHLVNGELNESFIQVFGLSIGVIFGAQLGATFSKRIHGAWIIRGLAIALGIVGVRIFLMIL